MAVSQSTQFSTQSTEPASQVSMMFIDKDIWGSLIPCNSQNPHLRRIDMCHNQRKYTFGRSRKEGVNDVILPLHAKMSQTHCTIEWDGDHSKSSVIITDCNSSNGTFIGDRKLGRGESSLLKDWSQISFGPPVTNKDKDARPKEDYRYIFRHMAAIRRDPADGAKEGLYDLYDISHVLGKGAYATVVRALHRRERVWYAIKMFPGDRLRQALDTSMSRGIGESTTTKSLMKEVTILQMMNHPNICGLKEAFYEGDSISIVLELCPGGDLMSYLYKRDVLLEPEAQDMTYQICDALKYMHRLGIVHRDLKPENVLLTTEHPPIVKVSDFGLAKVLDSLSVLQTKCGTRGFAAPEVLAHGTNGYDNVVDSWSLGVMVYFILTKKHPFADSHEEDEGPNWELLNDYNIVGEGEAFLRCLLEPNPTARLAPEQAIKHSWLTQSKARVKTRRLERELS
ncbi:kinase-like domain-containing protein, partial [Epithele typhae]|uniref:kinase-like domain-containing protein n=1 Tax=Epithele typhae TaxID=378194 RepID=UPI00200852B1